MINTCSDEIKRGAHNLQVDSLGKCLQNGEYPHGVGTVELMA